MLGLLLAVGAMYLLFGRSAGTSSSIPKSTTSWPKLRNNAMANGGHYFFILPFMQPSKVTDASKIATVLTSMGFAEVKVFLPRSLSGIPLPYPPDWASSVKNGSVGATGRWTGQNGATIDSTPLSPLGVDASTFPPVWLSTEDWLQQNVVAVKGT